MTKRMMKKAHRLTKSIKNKYPDVDYSTQLGISIAFLASKERMTEAEKALAEKEVKAATTQDTEYKEELLKEIEVLKVAADVEENAEAAVEKHLSNRTELIGSEKQVKWANDLLDKMVAKVKAANKAEMTNMIVNAKSILALTTAQAVINSRQYM